MTKNARTAPRWIPWLWAAVIAVYLAISALGLAVLTDAPRRIAAAIVVVIGGVFIAFVLREQRNDR